MGELFVKEKEIVVPGQTLAEGMDYLPAGGAYRDGENIRSSIMGVLGINGRVLRIIPLKSHYRARPGDMVIAKITEMTNTVWFASIDGYRDGILSLREVPEYVGDGDELCQYYNYGDYVLAKLIQVTRKNMILTMKGPGLRKLSGGRLVNVNPSKVPRVIGKQGSMIGLIKEKTGCRLIIGQNGIAWIQGAPEHELAAIEAIEMINERGHEQGLTEKIEKFLDERMKDVVVDDAEEKAHETEKTTKEKKSSKTDSKEESDEEEQPVRRAVGGKKGKGSKKWVKIQKP